MYKRQPLYKDAIVNHTVDGRNVTISPVSHSFEDGYPVVSDSRIVEIKQFNLRGELDVDTTDDTVNYTVSISEDSDAYDRPNLTGVITITDISGEQVYIHPHEFTLYPEEHKSYRIHMNSDPKGSVVIRVSRKSGTTDIILVDSETSTAVSYTHLTLPTKA